MEAPAVQFTRTSDGVSIAYMVWPGQGVPFLRPRALGAIPMGPGGTKVEDVRRFAGDRPMVQFDWRGTGRSARRIPASMDDLHLDVDAVMSVIDSDVVDVVVPGSAFLACTYAASRGKRWRSLLLTDPSLRVEGSLQGAIMRPGWEADYEAYLVSMVRNFLPPLSNEETERIARRWAEGVPIESHRAFRTIEQEIDLTETLGAIDMPVLILKVLPRSQAESVAALIPNSILLERHSGRLSRRLREQWDEYIGSKFADPPQAATASPGLSRRESEILGLLAAGRTNTEIATGLALSIRTVERHVQNIYAKLGVHNRVEAANWAREHGVL